MYLSLPLDVSNHIWLHHDIFCYYILLFHIILLNIVVTPLLSHLVITSCYYILLLYIM